MRTVVSVVLAVLGTGLAFLATIHLLLPSSRLNQSMSTVPLIAHGLAFPLPGGVALSSMGAVALVVVLRRRRPDDQQRFPGTGAATSILLAGVLLALSTTTAALPSPLREDAAEGGASFVLVSWNALDHFDAASAREIFGTLQADIAVLPELQDRDGVSGEMSRIQEALAEGGVAPWDYEMFESPPTGTHITPLTVIVRKGFAHFDSMPVAQANFGTVHLVPREGSGLPEILAVHTGPPVPRWMTEWKSDLMVVRDFAENAGENAIIAGDLNATMRHGGMGAITTHADVLAAIPAVERGTWPASVPRILRSSIDHVLIPVNAFAVRDARVVDISGSDHAAVATTISINQ